MKPLVEVTLAHASSSWVAISPCCAARSRNGMPSEPLLMRLRPPALERPCGRVLTARASGSAPGYSCELRDRVARGRRCPRPHESPSFRGFGQSQTIGSGLASGCQAESTSAELMTANRAQLTSSYRESDVGHRAHAPCRYVRTFIQVRSAWSSIVQFSRKDRYIAF